MLGKRRKTFGTSPEDPPAKLLPKLNDNAASFVAALEVGPSGQVVGIDMTDEQLNKARHLRANAGFDQITYHKGYIE